MDALTVQFVGAGDAFGSGGRFQTCIALPQPARTSARLWRTSLVAMRRLSIDPATSTPYC